MGALKPRLLLAAVCCAMTGQALRGESPAKPLYPPSPVIAGFELDWTTHQRYAPGSDNWPMTWAADDHQYTAWGDGGGFGGSDSVARVSLGVARIEGPPDNIRGHNIWGGKDADVPATFGGKSYGMLSLAGVLYMWVQPDPLPHLAETRIMYSRDRGRTWETPDWKVQFQDGLSIPTFLNFGREYAGARDEYVYSYFIRPQYGPGPSGSPLAYEGRFDVHRPGVIYLARVKQDRILDREGYQFFTGNQAQPPWSERWDQKRPVFEDANGVGWNVSVSFNAGLKRYLLCTEHGLSHLGKFGMFDAPEPWGPWTTVVYEETWGEGHIPVNTFFWSVPNKWVSADGRDFSLIFTGRTDNDSFNAVRGKFNLRTPAR